jgi:superfamily I DNA/RNA helicase
VPRLGRKTRLGDKQREVLWGVFSRVRDGLAAGGRVTMPMVFAEAAKSCQRSDGMVPTHFVVDEAQDISIPQLRFLAALAAERADGLFFAGDTGQRIFQAPFSWKTMGVDIRGRSRTLKMNYRTSHQIRRLADTLLSEAVADVDGNVEERRGTVSAFNGPEPELELFPDEQSEAARVAEWIGQRIVEGLKPHALSVFVRSTSELSRAMSAVKRAGQAAALIGDAVEPAAGSIAVGTMHDAKGLEFQAVVVMACDEEIVPLASRIEALTDTADVDVVYETERHLLYVACTRARDHLLLTAVAPGSEFLQDLGV